MQLLNAADTQPSKSAALEDTPLVFAVSGIYELPFGSGRKWLNNLPGRVNSFIDGWQIDGVLTSQDMIPLAFGNVLFTGKERDIALPAGQRGIQEWFNVNSGFNRISGQQLANNVRTFPISFSNVLGPPLRNVNLSLLKRTRIRENVRLEFRGEFTNAFNHPAFSAPNTNPTSSAFGTITSEFSLARRTQLGIKLLF